MYFVIWRASVDRVVNVQCYMICGLGWFSVLCDLACSVLYGLCGLGWFSVLCDLAFRVV